MEITASAKRPGWTWYATGPGIGIQLRSGRLVIPANHAVAGTQAHRSPICCRATTTGRTGRSGRSRVDGTNESQVVELADGRLMLNSRNHPAKAAQLPRRVHQCRRRSDAVGRPRRTRPVPEPPAQASLIRLPTAAANERQRLLFSQPGGAEARADDRAPQRRRRPHLAPRSRDCTRVPRHTPCLVVLPDGTAGVLYERGDRSPVRADLVRAIRPRLAAPLTIDSARRPSLTPRARTLN